MRVGALRDFHSYEQAVQLYASSSLLSASGRTTNVEDITFLDPERESYRLLEALRCLTLRTLIKTKVRVYPDRSR